MPKLSDRELDIMTNVAQEMANASKKQATIKDLIAKQMELQREQDTFLERLESLTGYRVFADDIDIVVMNDEYLWSYSPNTNTYDSIRRDTEEPISFIPGKVQNIIHAYKEIIRKDTK